ncbi:MAG: hypothetical protein NVS4B8_12900 [Herpetosiphon sp.]
MVVPVLPESAPFSRGQRAWLNGFFAGVLSLDLAPNSGALANGSSAGSGVAQFDSPTPAPTPVAELEVDFPWHDPTLTIDERLELAAGQPVDLRLMAAMAQLDCGTCGYVCRTYAAAIAAGTDKVLTKCTPGAAPTAKKLKEILATPT